MHKWIPPAARRARVPCGALEATPTGHSTIRLHGSRRPTMPPPCSSHLPSHTLLALSSSSQGSRCSNDRGIELDLWGLRGCPDWCTG